MSGNRKGQRGEAGRTYDSSGRQQRARLQHAETLDTAQRLFLEHGYATTTIESIAEAVGVSPATIYKSHGGKAGLIRQLCQRALAGPGPVPAQELSDALRSNGDPHVLIEGWARLTVKVSPLIAPLLLLLRDAALADPEAAALRDGLDHARLARMAENAQHLAVAGHLRPDVTTHQARDVLWLCSSPELYELLITHRRWSLTNYRRFIADTMTGTLL